MEWEDAGGGGRRTNVIPGAASATILRACTKLIRTWSIPGAEEPRHHLNIDAMSIDVGPLAWNKSKSYIKQSIEVGVRGKM